MKYKFTILFISLFVFLFFEGLNLLFEDGITGQTKRDGGVGCVCHRPDADPNVTVVFRGPDSVQVNQTAIFRLVLSHGPAITGGCDIASYHGIIDTSYLDFSSLKRDTARNELTHKYPKGFIIDSVWWTFKYIAPSNPQVDTLYACGNSTNNDFMDDTFDHWNFSMNRPIRVYTPIGIRPVSSIVPDRFMLYPNFPNPFNPSTEIKFDLPAYGSQAGISTRDTKVSLMVYDILGNEIAVIINEKLEPGKYDVSWNAGTNASGIYFLRMRVNDFIMTRKMILVK